MRKRNPAIRAAALFMSAALLAAGCGRAGTPAGGNTTAAGTTAAAEAQAAGAREEAKTTAAAGAQATAETAAAESQAPESASAAPQTEAADPAEAGIPLPSPGETVHGFTVTERGSISYLEAETVSFVHEKSGLTLLLVENEDPNLNFQIAFRVPQQDETDIPHIFEHSIIASSDKYPSKNIFFDLANKSCSTFVNAVTYLCMTCYPVSSVSQDQLEKMADVYMSCMEAPGVLDNQNFFLREAVRYQLSDPAEPITMDGTVFSEDMGYMTDPGEWSQRAAFRAMYPGTTACNMSGMLYNGYRDLKYENLQKVYDRYYSYDNAIVLLYGKLDWDRMLAFLDETWLSDEERQGKSALEELQLKPAPGHSTETVEAPAYEGDVTEQASVIQYYVDLDGFSGEELLALDRLGFFLGADSSPLNQKLREKGIYAPSYVSNNSYTEAAVNQMVFGLVNADPEQAEPFRETVLETLKEAADAGLPKSLTESALKEWELRESLSLEQSNVGAGTMDRALIRFMQTGKTDYFALEAAAEKAVLADPEGTVRDLCGKLLDAGTTCLVTASPREGLAEQLLAEQQQYLAEMKEGMSEEEIQELIRKTEEFNAWNASEQKNTDFIIDPAELPDPERDPEVQVREEAGIRVYTAPAEIPGAASFGLFFDISALEKEELLDYAFYLLTLEELDTQHYTREELSQASSALTTGITVGTDWPGKAGDANHRPTMCVNWISRPENFADSLQLVLEILQRAKYADQEQLLQLIGKYRESCNPASRDAFSTAGSLSFAWLLDSYGLRNYLSGPEFYQYLKEQEALLTENAGYAEELAGRMKAVQDKVTGRTGLLFAVAAEEDRLGDLAETGLKALSALPETETVPGRDYGLRPEKCSLAGVYMDTPVQQVVLRADLEGIPEVTGKLIPFIAALDDSYLTPALRFMGGAYSAGLTVSALNNRMMAMSYRDRTVGQALDILKAMPEEMEKLSLTEEDLKGYISASYGNQIAPLGPLNKAMAAIEHSIQGADMEAAYRRIGEIRETTLEDQPAAAAVLKQAVENSVTVMAGNRTSMEPEKERFDLILDYQKMGE